MPNKHDSEQLTIQDEIEFRLLRCKTYKSLKFVLAHSAAKYSERHN